MNIACWQGTFVPAGRRSFGDVVTLARTLCRVFPGLRFRWSPSGREKLRRADAAGVVMPASVREHLETQPRFLCAGGRHAGVALGINAGRGGATGRLWVTAEGDARAVTKQLARLAAAIDGRTAPERLTVVRGSTGGVDPHGGATLFIASAT